MAKASSPVVTQALAELRASIAALEAAAVRRETGNISADKLKTELTLVQDDRARLAHDLDAALARLGRYDQISAELEKRIVRTLNTVRHVIGGNQDDGDA